MGSKPGIIVVDLVNDFVSGKFGDSSKEALAGRIAGVLRQVPGNVPIIFTQDSHIHDDPEFKVWGEHCLAGEWGSELCSEMLEFRGYNLRKRHYDAFFQTDLEGYIRAKGLDSLYIFGISTDICVLHTVSGAFHRYFQVTVPTDLCGAIDQRRHQESLDFMKRNYGTRLIESSEMLKEVKG